MPWWKKFFPAFNDGSPCNNGRPGNNGQRAEASLAAVNALAAAQYRTASGNAGPVSSKVSKVSKVYTVAKGDSLSLIARRNGIDIAQLREWNQLKSDEVHPGQVLQVSSP